MSKISVTNCYYTENNVGRKIKISKQYHNWEFCLNGNFHKIELYHSRASLKKVLYLDGKILQHENTYKNTFECSFLLDYVQCKIIQTKSDKFDFLINEKNFNDYMIEEKNNLNLNDTNNYKKNYNEDVIPQSKLFDEIPNYLKSSNNAR